MSRQEKEESSSKPASEHDSYREYLKHHRSFLYERGFRIFGIPTLGIIVYLILLLIYPAKDIVIVFNWIHILNDFAVAITISILVWEGNLIISRKIDRHFHWNTEPIKRVIYQIAFNTIYTILVILAVILIDLYFIVDFPFDNALPFIKLTIVVAVIIFLLVQASYIGIYFFRQWEKSRFESEELKRKNLQSQFEALRNQVNPHFLFNSLNTLTTLIYEDQKLAVDFVQRIANVYRYVLQSKDKEVIGLKEELDFIKAYLFLQKIRFGENLIENIDVPAAYEKSQIPPLTLQMLVENAIKHNIVSAGRPLVISIKADGGDYIEVTNNLQKKQNAGSSTGIGLENIRQRYRILIQKEIEIKQDEKSFTVKIPLIPLKNENTNY
ncbi:MAG: sensor histidine kinase [Syntrophothermus sp.]